MPDASPVVEGRLRLGHGHEVWYRQVGEHTGATPLLILHGGPGAGSDYLEPLGRLADRRPVIFYDQLGCGRSDHPGHTDLWTVDYFAGEIDEVRAALGLGKIHLLGQSWGGWLAIDYMARDPQGVCGLVLASTSASISEFARETARLKAELPAQISAVLAHHEGLEQYDHPDYEHAVHEFYVRHVCRLPEWPDCLMRTVANLDATDVYAVMNGPNEFINTGTLRDWDRSADLQRIAARTLITVGRYDELTPACAQTLQAGIPDARIVTFEHSSHTAHLEETDRYLEVISAFLEECDDSAS